MKVVRSRISRRNGDRVTGSLTEALVAKISPFYFDRTFRELVSASGPTDNPVRMLAVGQKRPGEHSLPKSSIGAEVRRVECTLDHSQLLDPTQCSLGGTVEDHSAQEFHLGL